MTQRQKDKLEKLLAEKLREGATRPPEGMWSRLEASLRETETDAGEERGEGVVMDMYRRRTQADFSDRIRRGRRRPGKGVMWKYAVAVAVIVAFVVVGQKLGQLNDVLQQGGAVAVVSDAGIVLHDPNETAIGEANGTPAAGHSEPALAVANTGDSSQSAPRRIAGATGSPRGTTAQLSSLARKRALKAIDRMIADYPMNMGGFGRETARDLLSGGEFFESAVAESYPTVKSPAAPRSRIPDWYWDIADEEYRAQRKRETRGLTSSLYASNVAIVSGMEDVKGTTRALMSGMPTSETTHLGDGRVVTTQLTPTKLDHKFPVSFGLDFNYWFNRRLSVQSGLTYTYLRSEAKADGTYDNHTLRQEIHYVGIPLAVSYNFLDREFLDLYARAGGMLEKAVYARQKWIIEGNSLNSPENATNKTIHIKGLQPSLSAAAGVQLNVSHRFGIYAEPGVSYFVKRTTQPDNYRTENPFTFTLRAGLRINFR